ncbi:MAG: hypothetical protein AAF936_07475 [Pseudomonadota bacterium]
MNVRLIVSLLASALLVEACGGDNEGRETQQPGKNVETPSPTVSAAALTFAGLTVDLEVATANAQYKSFDPETEETVIFRAADVSIEPSGMLLAILASCTFKAPVAENDEDIPTIENDSAFCDDLFLWLPAQQLASPWELDPGSMRIQAFLRNGRAHDPLGILDGALPPGVDEALTRTAESFAVIATCKRNADCVSYGDDAVGTTIYLPCKDKLQCEAARKALRGLATASDISETARAELVADYAQIAYPIAMIAGESDAQEAAARVAQKLSQTPFLMSGADGWKYSITFEGASFAPPNSLIFQTNYKSEDEQEPATLGSGQTTIDLSQINPDTMAHASWGDVLPNGVFFVCEERPCVTETLGERNYTHSDWLLDCETKESCEAMATDLRGLIVFSRGEHSATGNEAAPRPQASGPARRIRSERDARKAADRITKNLAPRHFSYQQSSAGTLYKITNSKASMATPETAVTASVDDSYSPPALLFDLVYNVDETAQSDFESGVGKAELFLAGLKRDQIFPEQVSDDRGDWIIRLQSTGENAVELKSGSRETLLLATKWVVECKSKKACEEIAKDLRGLVDYAVASLESGGKKSTPKEPEADDALSGDAPDATIHANLSRAERRHINAFHKATFGSETYFPVTWGDATRLMQGRGVSVNSDGDLIVHRRACLALTPANFEPGDECKLDTLFQDYDLIIELGGLDTSSIKVRKATNEDARGRWVEAACRKNDSCARFVHTGGQASSIIQSLGEVESAPEIRMPCTDRKHCNEAANALRELVKRAPKPKRNTDARRNSAGGDLVGTWTLQQPTNPGWAVEYRTDGTYLFTAPNIRINGVYEAADGSFSTRAPDIGSEDSGTYRLIDNDTLEMRGNLGRSVWKRRS